MASPLTSAQRIALTALDRGVLRRTPYGWIVSGGTEEQVLPDQLVRWLFGERLVVPVPDSAAAPDVYRLSERGRHAAREANDQDQAMRSEASIDTQNLASVPIVLMAPAAHSEEMDYLLVVPLGATEIAHHRMRIQVVADIARASPERFEFLQYADEVYAVPISPRLAELELLPPEHESVLMLPAGLDDPVALGVRRCSDRGVNYGSDWVQWFGGFDRESPLIVGIRVDLEIFRSQLAVAERGWQAHRDS